MAGPPDAIHRLALRFGWPNVHLVLFALVAVGFSIPPLVSAATHPERNKDYPLWYIAGLQVREGVPLYPDDPAVEFPFMYPPAAAVFVFAPLTSFGWFGFVAAFCALTAVAWFGCLWFAATLAGGEWRNTHPMLFIAPGLATVAYVYDAFFLGQINLCLLFLVLGSAHCLRAGRDRSAGFLLGAAAAVKVFPLPVVAYFVVRRKWAAAAATVLTVAVVWVILPAPVRGFGRNLRELKVWAVETFGDQSGDTVAQRSSTGFTFHNQGLVAVSHRLLRPVHAGRLDAEPYFVNVADVDARTAQAVGYLGCLGLGGVILLAGRGRFARTPTAEAAEWGMVLTLAVLCSPLAWTYFFCWLLPAWAAVTRFLFDPSAAREEKWRVGLSATAAGVLLASALSEQFDLALQACGATCWGGVLLLLTCGYVVKCEGNRHRVRPEPRPHRAAARNWFKGVSVRTGR